MNKTKVFLDKGKVKNVPISEKADYTIPSGSDFLSLATNLIPSTGGVSGGRVLLGDKAAIQAISLTNREAPLVQAAPHSESASFEEHFGKLLGAATSPVNGTVDSVGDHEIIIKDEDNKKHTVELYHNFNTGKKSFIHHTPIVKVGDKVKKDQVLATSNYTDDKGNLALGVNLTTAIMPYRSNNFEDAFVITESGAKKLTAEQMFTHRVEKRMGIDTNKDKFISLFPNKFYNVQLATIDADGVVKKGTVLKYGDPVILAYAPRTLKTTDIHLGKLSKALTHAFKDMSDTWDYDTEGIVTDVAKQGALISVNIKTKRPMNIGDKISIYSGNKGVTGLILPDTLAPVAENGKPVDILLNSMSITSRVSPAMVSNLGLGKVAQKLGKPIKIPAFKEGSDIQYAIDKMKEHDVKGLEDVYDPVTGRHTKVLVGPLFFNRLVHIAADKLSERSQGVGYDWDMQPAKVEDEKSKRIGNLSTNALLSHGATSVLRDIGVVRSTKNDEFWLRTKLGMPAPAPKVPFIFNKFIDSLRGAGIKVHRLDDKFQILPQTDEDTTRLSQGAIENAKGFRVKGDQLIPEKGGMFDPTIVGILGNHFNHIDLHYKVPNPISEDPLRRLLKMTKNQFEDAIAKNELEDKLKNIDIDSAIAECKQYLKTGKISERSNAVKVLAFLNTLKKNNMHPKDLMLSKVPVIPAQYRPVQVAGDLSLSANANNLYKDLILTNEDLVPNKIKDVPDDIADKARLAQYNAVKAVYGLGDPVTPKHKEKGMKGLLAEMLGTHGGSAKSSVFQAKVVNKPLDLIGRGVATGDVKLDLDEISIPQDIAWKIFAPFLIRRLVRRGIPASQAKQYVTNRNPLAAQALQEEMADRPVVMSRDPALHKFNMMGFRPKINADPKNKTVSVNPLVFKGFNLDLDGDQISVSAPASEDAKEEIKDKMLPSKNLLSVRSFAPIYSPSNEAALGLYMASTVDNKNKPHEFNSEHEVIQAFNQGKLDPGDRIIIKGK